MRENNENLLAVAWWVILNSLDLPSYSFSTFRLAVSSDKTDGRKPFFEKWYLR